MRIFSKILKIKMLIKKSNFRLRKTCVSYQPCNIFYRLRDRELNHALLNTFLNERKWNIQDGGLKPEVDTAKRLFPFPHLIAKRFQQIYLCFRGHTNGICIYTVRLNWEEAGSAKSKIAAYTHEMRISHLPE